MDEIHLDSDSDKERGKSQSELINDFLFFESYNIVLLKEDLKRRVSLISPFFLDYLEVYYLSDFIISLLFKNDFKLKNYKLDYIEYFKSVYTNELNISYSIISQFLTKFTKVNLDFNKWVLFCITYSNLTS